MNEVIIKPIISIN